MRSLYRSTTYLLLCTFAWQTVLTSPLYADHIFASIARLGKESHYCGTEPATCEDGAIEHLAENIDWLEHHIDCYGSVVAKQPDIWGEARLTKHRDEFERILYQELNQFEFKLNAAISQSDQSFADAAFTLNQAAGGSSSGGTSSGGTSSSGDSGTTAAAAAGAGAQVDVNVTTPSSSSPSSPSSGPSGSVTPGGIDLSNFAQNKINVEPTVYLDQLSRYVQHLHELRRINEGDDTSDAPGYALNLVRIPVSLLPGKIHTRRLGSRNHCLGRTHAQQ